MLKLIQVGDRSIKRFVVFESRFILQRNLYQLSRIQTESPALLYKSPNLQDAKESPSSTYFSHLVQWPILGNFRGECMDTWNVLWLNQRNSIFYDIFWGSRKQNWQFFNNLASLQIKVKKNFPGHNNSKLRE